MSEPIWIILNQSEKLVVFCLVKNNPKSIRLNPIWSDALFRTIQTLDSFGLVLLENSVWIESELGLETWFGLERIHSDWYLELNRIDFWPFFIKQDTKRFSNWFALPRIQISESIGIVLIGLEWILIRYYRQGREFLNISWTDLQNIRIRVSKFFNKFLSEKLLQDSKILNALIFYFPGNHSLKFHILWNEFGNF